MVAELCEKLIVGRFESFKGTGKVVRLDHAFTAFSGGVVRRLWVDSGNDAGVALELRSTRDESWDCLVGEL